MLMIPLKVNSSVPLYEQIYNFIKNEIRAGKLTVAQKLPSTRNLSNHLQISRSTVELAYNQLVSEGYIESRPKSGYYILNVGELTTLPKTKVNEIRQIHESKIKVKYDFSPFSVDITEFPFSTWRRLSNLCMNDMNQDLFLLGSSQGDFSLREAIARYLHSSRGVQVKESQIIVGAGTDYLLLLLMQILKGNQKIAMEDPTYKRAYHIFKGLGLTVAPIPIDSDGIKVTELEKSTSNLAYVTPSHQYPMGVVMPIKRRMELLAWAAKSKERYIIEDDHDSEFRYKGKPIPCLQGMDTQDKVIYISTFSRAIAPAIRVGYMVLPPILVKAYQEKFSYYASTVSRVDQAIISEFINGGYFERHLNKMRTKYKNKHDVMLRALKLFGSNVTVTGEHAGLHIVAQFRVKVSEQQLIVAAMQRNIRLYGLNKHYITERHEEYPTLLLGFANVSEEDIEGGIRSLYEMCKELNFFV